MPTNIPPDQLPAWTSLLEELASGLARRAAVGDDFDVAILRWYVIAADSEKPACMGFAGQFILPEARVDRVPFFEAAMTVFADRAVLHPVHKWYPHTRARLREISATADATAPLEAILQIGQPFEHLLWQAPPERVPFYPSIGWPDSGIFPALAGQDPLDQSAWKPPTHHGDRHAAFQYIIHGGLRLEREVADHTWSMQDDWKWTGGVGTGLRSLVVSVRYLPSFCRTGEEVIRSELAKVRVDRQSSAPPQSSGQQPNTETEPIGPSRAAPKKLPPLPKHAAQAWQVQFALGGTQAEIAQILNQKLGTKYGQGQVSRMLRVAKLYAEQGRLAELASSEAEQVMPVDPSKLDLGERTDGRRRPRRPSTQDD